MDSLLYDIIGEGSEETLKSFQFHKVDLTAFNLLDKETLIEIGKFVIIFNVQFSNKT